MTDWPFTDPRNFEAFTTRRVLEGDEPILAVYHEAEDGTWQFMGNAGWKPEDLVLACLEHLVGRDRAVRDLADLPRGWGAVRRSASAPWERFPLATQDENRASAV